MYSKHQISQKIINNFQTMFLGQNFGSNANIPFYICHLKFKVYNINVCNIFCSDVSCPVGLDLKQLTLE